MLHTTLGRFTSRDPLGYVDGMSVYEYVRSMPLIGIDPLGQACGECTPGDYSLVSRSVTPSLPSQKPGAIGKTMSQINSIVELGERLNTNPFSSAKNFTGELQSLANDSLTKWAKDKARDKAKNFVGNKLGISDLPMTPYGALKDHIAPVLRNYFEARIDSHYNAWVYQHYQLCEPCGQGSGDDCGEWGSVKGKKARISDDYLGTAKTYSKNGGPAGFMNPSSDDVERTYKDKIQPEIEEEAERYAE
jgi:uncharacterized protein RhaS with RHS repeats